MTPEATVLAAVRKHASAIGARVFRNNTGTAYRRDGVPISFGLCVGSSDLIGWVPLTITADMVGQTVAVFVAIECKSSTGRVKPDQQNFMDQVNSAGGRAGIVRTVDDAERVVRGG